MDLVKLYDSEFYDDQASRSLQSARIVLAPIFDKLRPQSVVDIGCGVASWLCAALELGASDVVGVDGGYIDSSRLMIDPKNFYPADLSKDSLIELLKPRNGARFDIVLCLEVAEHLPYARSETFVRELVQLGDVVFFSAAVPFQNGTGHVNEQWPEFWAVIFRALGYDCFDWLRFRYWANSDVDWWYAQNSLLFVKRGSKAAAQMPDDSRVEGRSFRSSTPRIF